MGNLGFNMQLMSAPARDKFQIVLTEDFTLAIKREPASDLCDLLGAAYHLCRRTKGAAISTTLKSQGRKILIEMSQTNGMVFTVTIHTGYLNAGQHVGYVQWSDLGHWLNEFHAAL